LPLILVHRAEPKASGYNEHRTPPARRPAKPAQGRPNYTLQATAEGLGHVGAEDSRRCTRWPNPGCTELGDFALGAEQIFV
jgi:hypothetical protein